MYEGYRALELIIGPFKEWEGKKNDSGAISLLSTGSVDTFKIHARITKTIISFANISTISIWNLKRDTINRLRTSEGLQVKLMAGYENGNMEVLYTGGIVKVISERQNEDIVTSILCLTSYSNILKTQYSKTYEYGTKISTIVKEIASTIPRIVIDPTMIDLKGTIGRAGWSYMGNAKEALDRLAYQFGFSWSIDDGTFIAVQDGQGKKTGVVLDENSGLKKVSPQLFGIFQLQKGIDVESMYIPGVRPSYSFEIKSKVNPELSGKYVAHTVEYDLCPKTNAWDMNISFLSFFGGDFS